MNAVLRLPGPARRFASINHGAGACCLTLAARSGGVYPMPNQIDALTPCRTLADSGPERCSSNRSVLVVKVRVIRRVRGLAPTAVLASFGINEE